MTEVKQNWLYSMTCHPVLTTNVPQFWFFLFASVNYPMASRVEMAATGGVDRAGYIAS